MIQYHLEEKPIWYVGIHLSFRERPTYRFLAQTTYKFSHPTVPGTYTRIKDTGTVLYAVPKINENQEPVWASKRPLKKLLHSSKQSKQTRNINELFIVLGQIVTLPT